MLENISLSPMTLAIRYYFDYDSKNGILFQKRMTGNRGRKIREPVGHCFDIKREGYLKVQFLHKTWLLHRLIWIHVYGEPLPKYIDHIDGNTKNNRIDNLRACTSTENQQNKNNLSKQNTSGYKGVSYVKANHNYRAMIRYKNQHIHIGIFSTAEKAAEAYNKTALELFGEFAAINDYIPEIIIPILEL